MSTTTTTIHDVFYIGGEWVKNSERRRLAVVNPATEAIISDVEIATTDDAERAVTAAVEAFTQGPWPSMTFEARSRYLDRFADLIAANSEEFAELYVSDQGGLASFAGFIGAQAEQIVRYYADLGKTYPQGPETRQTPTGHVLINALPVGPVFASVPWNAPLILAVVKLAPALLAGCPVVIKSAPESPLVPYLMAELLAQLDLPAGVVSVLIGDGEVGRYLTTAPGIAHISFTGSTRVGHEVAHAAADHFTRMTLELGGKGASIILDDIDPADALPFLYPSSLAQSGQVCTTSSRLLVPESRYDEWANALTESFKEFAVGDPSNPSTLIGPLISDKQRASVEDYISSAVSEGAKILAGGGRPKDLPTGFYVEPTLVADVDRTMRIVQEEVFGPVITLQAFRTDDDAVAIANDTHYGLANAILTGNVDRALGMASRLRSGTVSINNFGSCLTQPFGGFGHSGIGREGGPEGLEAFFEYQQVQLPMQA